MLDKNKAKYIEVRKSKGGSTYKVYHFECISCGVDIKAQQNQLQRHSGKCGSCSQKKTPYMFIYNELKNHRRKDVEFTLTFDEFLNLISNPECKYCGVKLEYHEHSRTNGIHNTRAHQLDRKDNSKGYTFDNVVPCCWECNRLKSDRFTYDEFLLLSPILKEIIKLRNDKNRSTI